MLAYFQLANANGLTSWGIWLFYLMGQYFHILLSANAAVHSKINGIPSFSVYFKTRWIPIACRLFLTTLTFIVVWNNPSLLDIEKFMRTPSTQIAFAGILGWFSDSVFDKCMSFFPWLQKELPAIDPPNN